MNNNSLFNKRSYKMSRFYSFPYKRKNILFLQRLIIYFLLYMLKAIVISKKTIYEYLFIISIILDFD